MERLDAKPIFLQQSEFLWQLRTETCSDANLSDYEAEVSDDVANVDIDLGGPSNASEPAVEESSDCDEEDDAVKKKR
ncbi:hypothetical protein MRX96_006135 [Rhipicephalus microplus]